MNQECPIVNPVVYNGPLQSVREVGIYGNEW